MKNFKPGDLISHLDYKGRKVYSIVTFCYNRIGYMEIQVLSEGKHKALIYDGSKDVIKIEQEVENESRTSTTTLRKIPKHLSTKRLR
jgi:hypothetical protein